MKMTSIPAIMVIGALVIAFFKMLKQGKRHIKDLRGDDDIF